MFVFQIAVVGTYFGVFFDLEATGLWTSVFEGVQIDGALENVTRLGRLLE